MKDRLKKIAQWRPKPLFYTCGAMVALILLVLPLLRLAEYAVPWYDDYTYGRFAKTALEQNASFISAIKGALECVRISWYAWQGTYSSIFFMVLMPGIWGEEYYRFGPMFLILFLTFSVWMLVYTLLRETVKAERIHACGIASVSAAMAVVMIHTAQEGFYWYNGGFHYVGMHSFAMLLVVAIVKAVTAKSLKGHCLYALGAAVLSFITAGGNFVTTLQGLLALLSIMVLGFVVRKGNTLFLVPAVLVYLAGFYMNVTAPGNDKRADNYVGWGMSPLEAVWNSFVKGAELSWEFTGWMTLLFLLLLLPLAWNMVNHSSFSFRFPGLVTVWSVCFYSTGFTPSLFSLGHAGLDRTLNAVKLTWQLMLVLNLVYWSGWIVRHKEYTHTLMCRWWYYLLVAGAALLVFHTEPNQAGSFSSYGAYYYIHTGEAYNFYQEYLGRVEMLKSDEEEIVFEPYHWRPWFLCMGDLSDNPDSESNTALAIWYGKDTVVCVEKELK